MQSYGKSSAEQNKFICFLCRDGVTSPTCWQSYENIWILPHFLVTLQSNIGIIMPRKTDGIEFEIHPRPTKGEDGKPLALLPKARLRLSECRLELAPSLPSVSRLDQRSRILLRNKTRFRPTAPAYQGGCSKI